MVCSIEHPYLCVEEYVAVYFCNMMLKMENSIIIHETLKLCLYSGGGASFIAAFFSLLLHPFWF